MNLIDDVKFEIYAGYALNWFESDTFFSVMAEFRRFRRVCLQNLGISQETN